MTQKRKHPDTDPERRPPRKRAASSRGPARRCRGLPDGGRV